MWLTWRAMLEQSCHMQYLYACIWALLGNGKGLYLVCFVLISNTFGTVCWYCYFQNHHDCSLPTYHLSRWCACHVSAGDALVLGVGLRGNQHYQGYHCWRPVWVHRQGFIIRTFAQESDDESAQDDDDDQEQSKHSLIQILWFMHLQEIMCTVCIQWLCMNFECAVRLCVFSIKIWSMMINDVMQWERPW